MNTALSRLHRWRRRAVRRAHRNRVLTGLFMLVCVAVLLVSLPVTLPMALILQARDQRRMTPSSGVGGRSFNAHACLPSAVITQRSESLPSPGVAAKEPPGCRGFSATKRR